MGEQYTPATPPEPAHKPGTTKGEEVAKKEGEESGREEIDTNSAGRPIGKTNLKDDKGVGTQEPIDPHSPHMPPS